MSHLNCAGYVVLREERYKTVLEHRQVLAEYLGIDSGDIPRGLVVHHRDSNRANNELSNLVLMTLSDHFTYHRGRLSTTLEAAEDKAISILESSINNTCILSS